MKKVLQIFSFFAIVLIAGQKVSDYKYVQIPQSFKDFENNKYGLADLLGAQLKAKKFIIVNSTLDQKDSLADHPCDILKAEVSNTSNFLTNKVRVIFKNCEDQTVALFDGKSGTKDFELGNQEALQNALGKIPNSNPIPQINPVAAGFAAETPVITSSSTKNTAIASEKEVNLKTAVFPETKSTAKVEIYSKGSLTLTKIFLENGVFLLVNPNNSIPFATFKPAAKKGIYHVQLSDGTQTVGYVENDAITIEILNSEGNYKLESFLKR